MTLGAADRSQTASVTQLTNVGAGVLINRKVNCLSLSFLSPSTNHTHTLLSHARTHFTQKLVTDFSIQIREMEATAAAESSPVAILERTSGAKNSHETYNF